MNHKTSEEWTNKILTDCSYFADIFEVVISILDQGRYEGAKAMEEFISYIRCDSSAPIPNVKAIVDRIKTKNQEM